MSLALKIIPALIFWGILIYVVIQIPYPESITQASPFQIFIFFLPLFMALFFTINIFLNFMARSAIFAFGGIVFLLLKALDFINIFSLVVLAVAIFLLISYFKKSQSLSEGKIPKLKKFKS